jgi:hypothetical protein
MQFVRSRSVPVYSDYKKFRPYLRKDFRERCAYCERPEASLGGVAHCEIDHHRPAVLFPLLKCEYTNLYYCCRNCNSSKSNRWPRPEDEAKGRRFSDPCAEDLYSDHAVESSAGILRWKTECGRFTVDAIRLNREVLTDWRARRAQMKEQIAKFRDLQFMLRRAATSQESATQLTIHQQIELMTGFVADAQRFYGL